MTVSPRVGVVGHVEWIQFAVVPELPQPGAIIHASEAFEVAAGGGAVAAVQLARLAGTAAFFTALGDDDHGRRARDELLDRDLELEAVVRPGAPTRRGFTYLGDDHERTITLLDPRMVPHGDDPLPWERIATLDAVYFTGGDPDALRAARSAGVLVATPRALDVIARTGAELDVLVSSATDPGEQVDAWALDPAPRLVVHTRGASGGAWSTRDGEAGEWAAAPLPGPPIDAYGCGDTFAAGLTYGLGAGMSAHDAVRLGARCGAHCLTGRGPYGAQLTLRT